MEEEGRAAGAGAGCRWVEVVEAGEDVAGAYSVVAAGLMAVPTPTMTMRNDS